MYLYVCTYVQGTSYVVHSTSYIVHRTSKGVQDSTQWGCASGSRDMVKSWYSMLPVYVEYHSKRNLFTFGDFGVWRGRVRDSERQSTKRAPK